MNARSRANAPHYPGDALSVRPGAAHRASNEGGAPVRFLVVSAPTTANDRRPAPALD